MQPRPIRDAAETQRYVFVRRARCPGCRSDDLLTYKSRNQRDGTITRWTQCRGCGHKFVVIVQ